VRISPARMRLASRRETLFGEAPYGWRLSARRDRLVRDNGEQRVIAMVRLMYAEGMTIRDIVDLLDERGVLTRRGRAFSVAGVHRMLHTSPTSRPAEATRRR